MTSPPSGSHDCAAGPAVAWSAPEGNAESVKKPSHRGDGHRFLVNLGRRGRTLVRPSPSFRQLAGDPREVVRFALSAGDAASFSTSDINSCTQYRAASHLSTNDAIPVEPSASSTNVAAWAS